MKSKCVFKKLDLSVLLLHFFPLRNRNKIEGLSKIKVPFFEEKMPLLEEMFAS